MACRPRQTPKDVLLVGAWLSELMVVVVRLFPSVLLGTPERDDFIKMSTSSSKFLSLRNTLLVVLQLFYHVQQVVVSGKSLVVQEQNRFFPVCYGILSCYSLFLFV